MPKLSGIKTKKLFDKQIDKENISCAYNDSDHIYFSKTTGDKYISVTQLINNYCQHFDGNFWSAYKACETILLPDDFYSLKQVLLKTKIWKDEYLEMYEIDHDIFEKKRSEILQSYEDKKNIACERGTNIHAKLEELFYQGDKSAISKYAGGGKFSMKKGYYKLDLDRAIYPEFLISYEFDDYLKIAGQIDLLIKDGNDIIIRDWKTNTKIDMESYFDRNTKKRQMMKFPINNIQDCNFYHYSLQLSLYAYLLQKINPKFKIKTLAIVHFDHNGNETEYQCEYLKEDVARMLLHYRRNQKIKTELDLDKPIIF